MKKLSYPLLYLCCLALLGCTSAGGSSPFDGPSYSLPSISDDLEDERYAVVLLKPAGNELGIYNFDYEYDRVEVYRSTAEGDSARLITTINFPPPPHPNSFVAFYSDTLSSSLDSRYDFQPFSEAEARPALPVSYATSVSAYAAQLED